MSVFHSFDVSASAMTAHRRWMDVIASNLANAESTRTTAGGPFRRKLVTFMEDGLGVALRSIEDDPAPPRLVYDLSHPDADENGYVAYPNIDPVQELVDMISATRAYEANVAAFNAAKGMLLRAMEMGRA